MASVSTLKHIGTEQMIASELLDYMMFGTRYSCKAYHYYGGCNDRMLKKVQLVFMALLKINLPIHVIPILIFKLNQLRKK